MGAPRFYYVEGQELVSVTTFLRVLDKPFLLPWAIKEERKRFTAEIDRLYEVKAKRDDIKEALTELCTGVSASQAIANDSADFGRVLHAAIDGYFKNEDDLSNLTDKQRDVFDNFVDWWVKSKYEMAASEEVVYDIDLGFAGTLDARLVNYKIIDWKTGKGVGYPEHHLQNVAYRHAYNKDLDSKDHVTQGALIHIPNTGAAIKEHPVKEKYTMVHVEACLTLWRLLNSKGG